MITIREMVFNEKMKKAGKRIHELFVRQGTHPCSSREGNFSVGIPSCGGVSEAQALVVEQL